MPPKAAPCRLPPPPPRTVTEKAGHLRLGQVPGIFVQLACVTGVAAACDIAREERRAAGRHCHGAGTGEHARLCRRGIPAGSDLLSLMRANDALAAVTYKRSHTPAPGA